jgi:hypothetical protein
MEYKKRTEELLKVILEIAKRENKASGFSIGNTSKIDEANFYFTPVRNSLKMIFAGAIVYSEKQAMEIAQIIDGKVDYVLVDAEKKIPNTMSLSGEPANVERSVRETIKKSTLWVYKGNDLAVEAIDGFIAYLTKDSLRGVGGKKVVILGAGNLGCKLALKFVERGAHVFITRRDAKKLSLITEALNQIKPKYTTAEIIGLTDNEQAAKQADILIGMTQGTPVITAKMIENLASNALVVDGGKGTVFPEAISTAEQLGIEIYRLDVSAALEGIISSFFATEKIVKKRMGRRLVNGDFIVAGGLLAKKGDIVVDSAHEPKVIYGIADGKGDFIRKPSEKYRRSIEKIRKVIEEKESGILNQ